MTTSFRFLSIQQTKFFILETGIFDVIEKNLKQKINHVVLEIIMSLQSDQSFFFFYSNI